MCSPVARGVLYTRSTVGLLADMIGMKWIDNFNEILNLLDQLPITDSIMYRFLRTVHRRGTL